MTNSDLVCSFTLAQRVETVSQISISFSKRCNAKVYHEKGKL